MPLRWAAIFVAPAHGGISVRRATEWTQGVYCSGDHLSGAVVFRTGVGVSGFGSNSDDLNLLKIFFTK